MSSPLHIALVWHQHQSVFRSPTLGKYRQPWTRLYSIKDFLSLLEQNHLFPDLRQTINILPTAMVQLQDYALGTGFDPLLELLLSPSLSLAQRRTALEWGFNAPHALIASHPRYLELWEQYFYWGIDGCLERWQPQDYNDLLAWHNLSWFGPWQRDQQIQAWLDRGQDFSLSDRQFIYAKQRQVMGQIIPKYRQMQDQGRIELTGSTYTHPLLPLLWDPKAAKVAHPSILAPGSKLRWDGDILGQLGRGKQIYEQHFYQSPSGFWSPEQAVSPGILPPIAKQGYRWLISDEGVLGWSLGHYFSRDAQGNVLNPFLLYQPYRLETNYGDLTIVFRDQRLSDLISSSYSSLSPRAACQDLIDRLKEIYLSQRSYNDRPWLVTIAPDAPCWDNYPDQGQEFLTLLSHCLTQAGWLKTTTVRDYITHYPPQEEIPPHQLHSGSRIEAGFTPWMGGLAQNRAWEVLSGARQLLYHHPEATATNNSEAWEHLYAAESSEWFLGFGDYSCPEPQFDLLFREHLQGVYLALNQPIPVSLLYPLTGEEITQTRPLAKYITPPLDGMGHDRYWQAGQTKDIHLILGDSDHSSTLKKLWYGYNHFFLYLRLDFVTTEIEHLPQVHLCYFYPGRMHFISPIPLHHVPDRGPANYLYHHHLTIGPQSQTAMLWQALPLHQWQRLATTTRVKLKNSLEVAVPWRDLIPETGLSLRCVIFFSQDGTFQTCLGLQDIISVEVP